MQEMDSRGSCELDGAKEALFLGTFHYRGLEVFVGRRSCDEFGKGYDCKN